MNDRKIIIEFEGYSARFLDYLADKYQKTWDEVVVDALSEFYAKELREFERKEK